MAGLGLLENMRYFCSERESGIDENVSFGYFIAEMASCLKVVTISIDFGWMVGEVGMSIDVSE